MWRSAQIRDLQTKTIKTALAQCKMKLVNEFLTTTKTIKSGQISRNIVLRVYLIQFLQDDPSNCAVLANALIFIQKKTFDCYIFLFLIRENRVNMHSHQWSTYLAKYLKHCTKTGIYFFLLPSSSSYTRR